MIKMLTFVKSGSECKLYCSLIFLDIWNILFKKMRDIKSFLDKKKLKEFIKPVLQKMIKGLLSEEEGEKEHKYEW